MNRGVRRLGGLLAAIAVFAAGSARAEVELVSRDRLGEAIDRMGYCCVVDGRAEADRQAEPIADALVWREGLVVKPTMAVVVIGATNDSALRIADAVARSSNARQVIAVEGGAATWTRFLHERRGGPPAGMTFIVPKNTCEPGQAVLELERK